jgi:hypothetical protein
VTLLFLVSAMTAHAQTPAAPSPTPAPDAAPAPSSTTAPDAAPAGQATVTEAPVASDAEQSDAQPALDQMCVEIFRMVTAHKGGLSPIAVVPLQKDEPLAVFVADYLVYCLGTQRGLLLLERTRLKALIDELKLDYASGDASALEKLGDLTGARAIVSVGVESLGTERVVSARLSKVSGEVLGSVRPLRVPDQQFRALYDELFQEKSRWTAIGLSAGLPGAGQLYNGERVKGGVIMAAELGLLGGALFYQLSGSDHEDAYHENRANTVARRQDAEADYETRNILLFAALGVWALQMVDVAFNAPPPPSLETRFEAMGNGVRIRW